MSYYHRHRRMSEPNQRGGEDLFGDNSNGNRLMDLEYHVANAQLEQLPIEVAQLEATSRIEYYTEPRGASADRFRILRMRLRELQEAKSIKTLLVTSPLPHDGKSTMVLNLATALSERGRKAVLVVEGDLHRPTLTQLLGVNNGLGLSDCLAKQLDPMSVIRRVEPLSWYLLPAGAGVTNASELLHTGNFPGVIQKVVPHFDWILMDSPPVLPLTDTLSLAKNAEATLLVARAGQTARRAVDEAIAALGPRNVCGIILNGIEQLDRYYSAYGYY